MPEPDENSARISHDRNSRPKHMDGRQVLELIRKKNGDAESLAEALSAALQAADSEFGKIVKEVDQIFRLLKSPHHDKVILRIVEHPAVWCAMKQALVDRELRQLAITDDLTCVFSRRGFFAAATQQIKRAMRKSERLLLFRCDVDDLKRINHTYGHREGDLALMRTAETLEKCLRGSDIVARLGGDEFVVLALETGERSGEVIQRRLAKAFRKKKEIGCGYELSLSIGAAEFNPEHPVTLGELMSQADKAMHEQKQKRQLMVKLDDRRSWHTDLSPKGASA